MVTNDIEQLNFLEKIELLYAEKTANKRDEFDRIRNALSALNIKAEGHTYKTSFTDLNNDIEYMLHIFETPFETEFSISIRFLKHDLTMLRFDFTETKIHKNNFGTDMEYKIQEPHIHFFSPNDKHIAKNVVPISDIAKFKNLTMLTNAFEAFISYTNLKR